jgi:hypothetical protein
LVQETSPSSRQAVAYFFHSLLTLPSQGWDLPSLSCVLSAAQVCCPDSFEGKTEVHLWPLLLVLDLTVVSRLLCVASRTGQWLSLMAIGSHPHPHNNQSCLEKYECMQLKLIAKKFKHFNKIKNSFVFKLNYLLRSFLVSVF